MKKIMTLVIISTTFSCNHPNNDKELSQEQVQQQQVIALAKKYDIDLKFAPNTVPNGKKSEQIAPITLEQLEKEFQAVANQKKLFAQESKEIQSFYKELKSNSNLPPSAYYAILEKYPLAKQSTIDGMGGKEAFDKRKSELLEKQRIALQKGIKP